MDGTVTQPVSFRMQKRLIAKAKAKAQRFGMKMPSYISMLVEKDTATEPEPEIKAG